MMLILLCAVLLFIVAFVVIGRRFNEINWGVWWVNIFDGWIRLFAHRYHRLHGDKIDLPNSGGVLLICNHVSGLDPLLLIAASKRPLHFLIAEEEYNRFGLTWIFRAAGCIPVDRGGRTDAAFRAAVRALKNGDVVALFPHGRIHPDHESEARIKPGALRLATLAQVPIYTARLTGVAGVGEVIASVFKRSHAHIQGLELIEWQDAHGPDLRQQVGELLLGRRNRLEIQKT
jgi:1-acyl-sn-glycerol-3-phosphate acyltransferase